MYQIKLIEVKNRLPDLIDIAIKGEDIFIFLKTINKQHSL